jgi:hypothetical protein
MLFTKDKCYLLPESIKYDFRHRNNETGNFTYSQADEK